MLVAVGGGVVGDMAGFAAATYQRGIAHLQVPTTLLAQVDSSVGGKTAINHPLGKNMIGAFHQPLAVIADTATLATLPAREFAAGLAEVVKYGAIRDAAFLAWIEANADALLRARCPRRSPTRSAARARSRREIVAADEREAGVRALLNFGHTFGHAIEIGGGLRHVAARRGGGRGHGARGALLGARAGASPPAQAERLVGAARAPGPAGRSRPRFALDDVARDTWAATRRTRAGASR